MTTVTASPLQGRLLPGTLRPAGSQHGHGMSQAPSLAPSSPWHSSSLPFPPSSLSTQHPEPRKADVSVRAEERFERWGNVTAHTSLETPCLFPQLPTPVG